MLAEVLRQGKVLHRPSMPSAPALQGCGLSASIPHSSSMQQQCLHLGALHAIRRPIHPEHLCCMPRHSPRTPCCMPGHAAARTPCFMPRQSAATTERTQGHQLPLPRRRRGLPRHGPQRGRHQRRAVEAQPHEQAARRAGRQAQSGHAAIRALRNSSCDLDGLG